jgi:type VI secretion system protein ImpL
MVRGVYFTSGTQEGSPIDRVLGTLARSFNLERKVQPPAAAAGKSYFLKRLLHEVIFGESGLAGHDAAAERRRQLGRLAAYAALAVVTVALALLWTASFVGNRALVAAAETKTAEAKRELEALPALKSGDEVKLIAMLNRLRELRDAARGRESGLLRAGFYQGDKLGAQAERAYRNALRDGLLPHVAASLGTSVSALARRDPQVMEAAAVRVWKLPDSVKADFGSHLREALAER